MSKAINVNMKANVNDFRRIEQRIAQVLADTKVDGLSKEEQAEADKRFKSTLNHYTGPATGLVWDDETGKISIASGFHADAEGTVVKD
ncbi:MAG: hypothetical protein J6N19_13030 [Clostridium sp.]|nr:hypothetical protein [Clostridium sp.]